MIERILEVTTKDLEKRFENRPLDFIKANVVKSQKNFKGALKKGRSAVILECKKASPSLGVIRENYDVRSVASTYAPFADAISVLTNSPFFQGDLNHLRQAREVTSKPLLCKDFILSPYQVYEARYLGADAILLMMSLLSDKEYSKCAEVAVSLGMDILTEVHDENELQRAINLRAEIIGVNNRDFRTLKVDLSTAQRLLPQIPHDIISVFESGVSTHQQIKKFASMADAFLIGTSLMKQPNLENAIREIIFGRIKICGLTRLEDAKIARDEGAVFGGLIFAEDSPRCISLEQAKKICEVNGLGFAGVFVNQSTALIASYVNALNLYAVQLHGDESAHFVSELRKLIPKTCEIWKAVRVTDLIPPTSEYGCDRILLDSYDANYRGGTGQTFDWRILENIEDKESYILSGGLSPQNINRAQGFGFYALDVNSKVESAKGVKDAELIHQLFEELR